MREKLKNMMWGEPTGEWIPYTYAESAIMWNICEKLPEIPIAEPVPFTGESNGRRTTEKQASLYDAMLAEIYAEHDGNKAKVRNRRSERRNHMAENWEAEKDRRRDMHWNHLEKKARRDAGCKYGNHWASNAERKVRYAEIIARKDWEIDKNCDYAEMLAEIQLRKMIERADKDRTMLIGFAYQRISSMMEHIKTLEEMELPTDEETLRKFHDDMDEEEYSLFPTW